MVDPARAWGVYSVFMLEDVASDSLDFGSVISSTVLFWVCSCKRLLSILKSLRGLACLVSGAGKTTTLSFLALRLLAGGSPGLPSVMVLNEFSSSL